MCFRFFTSVILLLSLYGCEQPSSLPVYGAKTLAPGTTTGDSVDYTLPDFSFVNQDSQAVSLATVQGKVIVTEFFFTSCPSICPKMQAQMLRVYEKYKDNINVVILAFTIDPVRDTVGKLHSYADKLDITTSKWHLLTGDKDSIYSVADNFLVSASEDPDAPGGHVHSGNFILADTKGRLRGYYDGTKEESVEQLLSDIDVLLRESK